MVKKENSGIIITQENCGHCADAKELFKNEIASGNMKIIPIETKRGEKLANQYNLDVTPTILFGKGENNLKKCYLGEKKRSVVCDDGSEKQF